MRRPSATYARGRSSTGARQGEVALVLFCGDLACEEGEEKLLEVLLLSETARLVLIDKKYREREGFAH